MKKPTDTTLAISADYRQFIEELKARVIGARISAARSVSYEATLLYWDIGRGIIEKQQTHGWGDSVVEMVAADLRHAFPGSTGFSADNGWRMRQFFLAYASADFLGQLVPETPVRGSKPMPKAFLGQPVPETQPALPSAASGIHSPILDLLKEIPWGQNLLILKKLTSPAARLWYLRATARFGWSRNVLLNQIKAGAYERAVTEKKTHNFEIALPEHFAEQADEMLKSSYNLEFLGLRRARMERPGGPAEISRGWSVAEPPDRPTHTFKPRQGRQKFPVQSRFARFCRPCRGSRGLLDGFRGFRSFLAPPPANFFGPSRGRSHVRTKANPIGVAAYALQSKLPGELKGKLPTAKQLADIVRAEMEGGK